MSKEEIEDLGNKLKAKKEQLAAGISGGANAAA